MSDIQVQSKQSGARSAPRELQFGSGRATSANVAITVGGQAVRAILQLCYQAGMAHLLDPRDFGLVALVAPIVAFTQLLANLGLSQATIQQERISANQVSALFWVNAIAGTILGLGTMAAAPLLVWFYDEPRVRGITIAFGSFFFLTALYAQHLAVLTRKMHFGRLVTIDVLSFSIGAASGIAAAAFNWGYWSIVIGQGAIATSGIVLAWSLAGWKPGWPRKAQSMRTLLSFGGDVTAFNIINFFARNLDNILIGKVLGAMSLGIYDRAYKLMLMPLSQVSAPFGNVALPALAKVQNDPASYRRCYLNMLAAILLLTQPGALFALCTCDALVSLVLGAKWIGAVPIFAILAAGIPAQTVSTTSGWLYISQGRTAELRNWGFAACPVLMLSFVVGLPWGVNGVAVSYVVATYAITPFLWWKVTRKGPVRGRDIVSLLVPFALAWCGTGAILLAARVGLAMTPLVLGAMLVGAYLSYIGFVAVHPAGRTFVRSVYASVAGLKAQFA